MIYASLGFAAGFAACWFAKDWFVAAYTKVAAAYNWIKAKF